MTEEHDRTSRRALTLYARLMRAANSVSRELHEPLAPHGLSVSQFGVLEALKHKGELELRQLARAILKTSGNITTVVRHLERDGLIHRKGHERDGRRVVVGLTDAGRELIDRLFPVHGQQAAKVMTALTTEEQRELSRLLRRLEKR